MIPTRKFFLCAILTPAFLGTSAGMAAVIAATNFDGRTLGTTLVSNDTAVGSSLNWTTNGVNNPGSMNALAAGTTGQALFNTTALTMNMFAPALNVGNADTFWTTNISLTVSAGSIVSLTDVTFDYWAISGSAVQNTTRLSDFTVSLFDPSMSPVTNGSVFIDNASNGTISNLNLGTPISAVFTTPIALSAPGTYSLRITAAEAPETGNHIGIDNLFINGTASPVPEPTSLALSALGILGLTLRRRRTR